jgi:ribosomal protein L7/L12
MIGWPCPKCGNENEANVVFCVNCGNQIIKYCQKCGTGVPVNGKYCPECRNDTFDISGKYDVILTNTGWKKIYVIREIRVWSKMKLGLYEAKSMADKPPSLIAVEIPLKEGQQLKSSLEKYGATVELRPHINKK